MIMTKHKGYVLTGFFKSHPSLPSSREQKLIPRLRLPRSCLPLAYLDPLGGPDDFPGSNLFSAHTQVLEELVHTDRRSNQPTVLIAQSAIDGGLSAIEHVQDRIYAMCRLGNWVSVNMLDQLHTVPTDSVRLQKRQDQEQPGFSENKWWSTAAIDFEFESKHDQSNNSGAEKTRVVQLCLQRTPRKPITPAQITQEISQPAPQDQTGNVMTSMVETAAQDPEEVFKMVKAQYQEALYASKVGNFLHEFLSHITDCKSSRPWHILQKGHCLEQGLLFPSPMALPIIPCV